MSEWVVKRDNFEVMGKFLGAFCKDGEVVIRDSKMSCIVVDAANVAIAQVEMDVDGDAEATFKLDFEALTKALSVSKAESVIVSVIPNMMVIKIGSHVMRITELSMLSKPVKHVPKLKYETCVKVEAKEILDMLAGIVRALDNKVVFKLQDKVLSITVEGTILQDTFETPVDVEGDVRVVIPSDYLEDIAKGLKGKCKEVSLEMRTDSPLIVKAEIDGGRVGVMIAPRIVSD